jgi:DNA polymerase
MQVFYNDSRPCDKFGREVSKVLSLDDRGPESFDRVDQEIGRCANAAGKLEVIAGYVRVCELCVLHERRVIAVPGEGAAGARLMIIGEAPGAQEDACGRPFVGRSGELLSGLLTEAVLPRGAAFITSIVKCRSADPLDGRMRNRAPRSPEIKACRPYLVRQLEIIRPRAIVCLGRAAAHSVIGSNFNLTEQRGVWLEGPAGSRIIATFHPAYLLRNGGAGLTAAAVKKSMQKDFTSIREYLDSADKFRSA